MEKENKLGNGGRLHFTLRDSDTRLLSEMTGLSRYAAEEIVYLFCDISHGSGTRDIIEKMLGIAAEKNARERLDDPAGLSLFLKRGRKKSAAIGKEVVALDKSAAEEEILRTALAVIVGADEASTRAAELTEKFGSALTVYDAAMSNISYVGVKSGVAMRLAMLLYIYLWNGKRGLTIGSRAEASRFFGEIYLGGGSDGTVYGFLDGEYRLIDVHTVDERFITEKRAEAAFGIGSKLGAKYVIASRKYSGDDLIAYRDLASRVAALSKLAKEQGIMLLDFIVHKRNSFFALRDGAISDGGKIEFDEFLF